MVTVGEFARVRIDIGDLPNLAGVAILSPTGIPD